MLVDWTSTRTTLLFEEWINVEQIMAYVFRQRCTLEYKRSYGLHSGRVVGFVKIKLLSGFGLLLVVVLILWGPLVLSVLSQVLTPPTFNNVTAASLEVSLNITNVMSGSSVIYSLFSIKARQFVDRCRSGDADPAIFGDASVSSRASSFDGACKDGKLLQEIQFNGYSDSIWTATPDVRSFISQEVRITGPGADKVSFRLRRMLVWRRWGN